MSTSIATAEATTPEASVASAVQRCLDAYHATLAIPRKPDGTGSPHDYAARAYRNAMPFLSSPVQIDAFIACVAHGLLINVFNDTIASKLLYAAQVAIASRRAQQKQAHPLPFQSSWRRPPRQHRKLRELRRPTPLP